MNYFNLVGRLTKDPELKYTQAGTPLCNFTLAVDKNFSKEKKKEAQSNNKPTADFIRIQVWGQRAEVCNQYLSKGSQCAVAGRIQTDSYQDDSGKMIYSTYFIGENVEFLGNGQERSVSSNNNNASTSDDDFFDDDFKEIEDSNRIPF